ncbi:hypothetical protein DFR76_10128 [Nocardia pseudobrasiliensis]|uniref:Uncharacterized protein n=2 Tax=Nocardia pseudobrasiliensis TaxID=45979 RepID=A0A370ICQ6_9NOCA|nr:hypothetical protein DFR76_10128 [Nocardia pseudobrasiliensis]
MRNKLDQRDSGLASGVFLKPQRQPSRGGLDVIGAVLLFVGVFFFGNVLTFVVGMLGAPGGASSECTGQCRTYVDAGSDLMGYGTYGIGLVVLILIAWSVRRERRAMVWPLLSIPVLILVAIVSFWLAAHGAASAHS